MIDVLVCYGMGVFLLLEQIITQILQSNINTLIFALSYHHDENNCLTEVCKKIVSPIYEEVKLSIAPRM